MAEGELPKMYAERLKALHSNSDLFQRLQVFVHDLVTFKNNKHVCLRLLQEPTAEFYMSLAYFSPEEAHALLSFQCGDGLTLEQALQAAIARILENTRDGFELSFELCTSHLLALVLQDHFAIRKGILVKVSTKSLLKKFANEHRKNQHI